MSPQLWEVDRDQVFLVPTRGHRGILGVVCITWHIGGCLKVTVGQMTRDLLECPLSQEASALKLSLCIVQGQLTRGRKPAVPPSAVTLLRHDTSPSGASFEYTLLGHVRVVVGSGPGKGVNVNSGLFFQAPLETSHLEAQRTVWRKSQISSD